MQVPPHTLGQTGAGRTHRYPTAGVVRAAARAAAGSGIAMAIWLAAGASWSGAAIALPLTAIFVTYGIVACLRGLGRVVVDGTGITVTGPLGGRVEWSELTGLRLLFYATRRRSEFSRDGWMVLEVRGGGNRVNIESEIDGFADIAKASRAHAEAAGVALSAATSGNFVALETGVPPRTRVRGLRSVLAQR